MMAAPIRASAAGIEPDTPRELFTAFLNGDSFPYDVTADGQRFLQLEVPGEGEAVPLNVVVNWQAGLK
jgi:hypothetical protein